VRVDEATRVAVLRSLRRRIQEEALASGTTLHIWTGKSLKEYAGFHVGWEDGTRECVFVRFQESHQKVEKARPGFNAVWKGTGHFRLCVFTGSFPTISFKPHKNGAYPLTRVSHQVFQYLEAIRQRVIEQARRMARYDNAEAIQAKLVAEFNLVTGGRRPPVSVHFDETGLTLDVDTPLTEGEMRELLQACKRIGILPGGQRGAFDPPEETNGVPRFERV
jgi:hypothetical protein